MTFAGMLASRGSSAECRLSAPHAHLDEVTISAGSTTFPLGLEGVPAEIVVEPGVARANIHVEAPLEFDATHPVADLRLRVTKTVDFYGGRVRVGQGLGPIWQGVEGDAMRVSLKKILGVEVSGTLAVPCRSIGLENRLLFSSPYAIAPPKARTVGIGAGPTPLFVGPVATEPLEITYPGQFEVRQRRPGWVLIESRWADGSRLRGWTFERNIKADAAPVSGRGEGGKGRSPCVSVEELVLTRMTIRRGAAIAASPGGPIWAHTTKATRVAAVPIASAEDGWVLIGALSGLRLPSCTGSHSWVQLRDIVRPKSTTAAP